MRNEEALQVLGLSYKEARVYLAILEIGQGSAHAIADIAGLKRPTTYVIIGELIERGLVSRIPRARKKLYVAKSPDEFFAEAEDRFENAKLTLPRIRALTAAEQKPRILYFEGDRGIREVALYRLQKGEKNIVGFYGGQVNMDQTLIDFFDEFSELSYKQGFTTRGIVPYYEELGQYRERDIAHGRIMKIISPEEYASKVWIHIGETYVTFSAPKDKQGVIIENKDIAKAMKDIFEMVWKSIPEKVSAYIQHFSATL